MKTAELLTKVRSRLSDTEGSNSDRLWSDAEIIDDYANEAMTDLFRGASGLAIDSATAADSAGLPLCTIPVVATVALYRVSDKILQTTRFQLQSQVGPIPAMTVDQLDRWNPNWQNLDAGAPVAYCTDWQSGHILLVPAPAADDTAKLTNSRLPLNPLSYRAPNDILPFREEYHKDLIPKILSLAFLKGAGVIADVYKPQLAAGYESEFSARVDKIKIETYRRNKGQHTNRSKRAYSAK